MGNKGGGAIHRHRISVISVREHRKTYIVICVCRYNRQNLNIVSPAKVHCIAKDTVYKVRIQEI